MIARYRRSSSSTWTAPSARPTVVRRAPPTTAISGVPAITLFSCSTSSAILSDAPCAPAASIALMAGATFWNTWSPGIGIAGCGATSEAMQPLPHRISMSSWKPRATSTPSVSRPTRFFQESIVHLLTRPVGRPPNHVRRFHASFSYQAGSWSSKRRVVAKIEWHPGQLFPRVGFIVTNLSRPAERVTKCYNGRGTAEQYIKEAQERDQLDAAVMSQLPQQRGASSAARLGLQPGQLHANIGFAEGGRALVVDHAAGEAGEDRREGGQSRAVRHLPTSGGRRPKSPVR